MILEKLKICLLALTISSVLSDQSFAQNFDAKLGIGNYEAINVGLMHTFKNWNLEYGLGTDFNIYDQGYFNVLHVGAGKQIFIKKLNKNHKVFLQAKTFIWNIENRSNVFSAISFSTNLLYKIKLNENYQLGLYDGVIWSSVFRYKRKTYQDIGFPKEWQPNFGITLYYRLK